jgi:hypothetical protein
MIQAGAMRVEPVSCAIGLGVQAEQLPSIKREHGVVEAVGLLVLVENGLGGQQLAKPASASPQVSHGHLARSVGHPGWAAAISAPTALPAAGPLSSVAATGHACSRSFPSTVRSASLMCACAAWRRGKRPAIRGLNRPRLISWHQVPGWNPSQPGDGGPCTSPK